MAKREKARSFKPNKKYTHYQVGKADGKIYNGWEYPKGMDKEDIMEYYKLDLQGDDHKLKDFSLVKKKNLKVDPQDWNNWYKPVL